MTNRRINVLVADDHEVVRAGLDLTFRGMHGVDLVGVATNGAEVLALIKQRSPDIVITDLRMPGLDGIELIKVIKELVPDTPVLILTVVEDSRTIRAALDAGAAGYLLKSAPTKDVRDAIRQALRGELVVSSGVGSIIASLLTEPRQGQLSAREIEVLNVVARGMTNAQVARRFRVSETTVRTHLRRTFVKLNVQDRTSAVTKAIRRGLIDVTR